MSKKSKKKESKKNKDIVRKYTEKDIPELVDNLWYVPIYATKLFNIELNGETIGMEYRPPREPFKDSPDCLYLIKKSYSTPEEAKKDGGNVEPINLDYSLYYPTFDSVEKLIKHVVIK